MRKQQEIDILKRRVQSLEDMTLSLIGFIEEKLHIDSWDDRVFLEEIRGFEKGMEDE